MRIQSLNDWVERLNAFNGMLDQFRELHFNLKLITAIQVTATGFWGFGGFI